MSKKHWADQRERGSLWMMRITALLARKIGRRAISPLLYLIVFYFFIFGRRARHAVAEYQDNLAQWSKRPDLKASIRSLFKQYILFADSLLDKLDTWNQRLRLEHIQLLDPDDLHPQLYKGRGQMLIGSHLGNLEVCRALAELHQQVRMNVLVHTKHAEQFNQLLGEAGADQLRLIQVSELDPATMLQLSERLDNGEWLAIAGDRVPLHGGRTVTLDFLGHPAPFPQGPWLLAGLLKCPVNLLSCLKIDGRYEVRLEKLSSSVQWKRGEREQQIGIHAQRYADRLAQLCLTAPQQWFNFYPFWTRHDDTSH